MGGERGEAGHVLVADIEPVLAQLSDGGVHVPRVEEHEGVEDQAEDPFAPGCEVDVLRSQV